MHEGKLVFSKKGPIANLEKVLEHQTQKWLLLIRMGLTEFLDVNSHPHLVMTAKLIVRNGTIDNYLDIKTSLENEGFDFLSESDTGLFLTCYQILQW